MIAPLVNIDELPQAPSEVAILEALLIELSEESGTFITRNQLAQAIINAGYVRGKQL